MALERRYSMNAGWAEGEEMASTRNGSGDEYSIVFSAAGVYVRGFDHESAARFATLPSTSNPRSGSPPPLTDQHPRS
ncbi:hypothetical protein GFH48_02255 [Streptomyces fagopyri]|uniref:Uncharacterized protein n=1 Tax=Streptomyces fagopyri TaxID=2662397 RepID=A0A5Q0L5H6_9ACTN|nr:hypothetical protein GFH48_02255 [Streptomyces fagopyri]